MASLNNGELLFNVYNQSLDGWKNFIILPLAEFIHKYLIGLYDKATIKFQKDQAKRLAQFQDYCMKIPNWSKSNLQDETNKLLEKLYPGYDRDAAKKKLQNAIHSLLCGQLASLSITRTVGSNKAKIPRVSVSNFVHTSYGVCGSKIGFRYPYLFDRAQNVIARQQNHLMAHNMIKLYVENVLVGMVMPSITGLSDKPEPVMLKHKGPTRTQQLTFSSNIPRVLDIASTTTVVDKPSNASNKPVTQTTSTKPKTPPKPKQPTPPKKPSPLKQSQTKVQTQTTVPSQQTVPVQTNVVKEQNAVVKNQSDIPLKQDSSTMEPITQTKAQLSTETQQTIVSTMKQPIPVKTSIVQPLPIISDKNVQPPEPISNKTTVEHAKANVNTSRLPPEEASIQAELPDDSDEDVSITAVTPNNTPDSKINDDEQNDELTEEVLRALEEQNEIEGDDYDDAGSDQLSPAEDETEKGNDDNVYKGIHDDETDEDNSSVYSDTSVESDEDDDSKIL